MGGPGCRGGSGRGSRGNGGGGVPEQGGSERLFICISTIQDTQKPTRMFGNPYGPEPPNHRSLGLRVSNPVSMLFPMFCPLGHIPEP